MTDEEFIEQFENCTLPAECFHHRDHIRMTWVYLRSYSPIEALVRVCDGIKRFAAANGKAERYHETITWAYVFLIRERMARAGSEQSWEQFASDNADLLDWKESILKIYYDERTLSSDLARKVFVSPTAPASQEESPPTRKIETPPHV